MKGVILAGGLGTRLYPLTYVTNKHLLPVYNKPMIFYPIETLVHAGIRDIVIVTSGPHVGHFLGILRNGKELGIKHLEYVYQEKADGGIADALSLAEDFADGKPITVILGDNTTDADITKDAQTFQRGGLIFLKQVSDPQRFGVPRFDPKNPKNIAEIIEKPANPPTNYAVTGLYMYDNSVFSYIKSIQPSARKQLEITDVNNMYIQKGELRWATLDGFWKDAGTINTLYEASTYWYGKVNAT